MTTIYPLRGSKTDAKDAPATTDEATPGEVLSQTLLMEKLKSLLFPRLPDEL